MRTPETRAWQISGGEVDVLELPPHPDSYYVPEGVTCQALDTQKPEPVCLVSGAHDPDYESFTLPLVAEIARRVTPWSVWYLAPAFFGGEGWRGMAWSACEVAICRTHVAPVDALSIAFHEAWHLAEGLLRRDILDALDARLATGPPWPGDYYPRVKERRARAFTHFAMMLTEGCQQVAVGPSVPYEVGLFWSVYNGDFGREVMQARAPRRPGTLSRVGTPLLMAARAAKRAAAARRAAA